MKKRDILREIYDKKITEKQAEALVEEALEKAATQDFDLLGFDLGTEWTALALHGISYKTVARWRYEGWPNVCVVCKKKLDVKNGNWMALKSVLIHNQAKRNVIVHWDCKKAIEGTNNLG